MSDATPNTSAPGPSGPVTNAPASSTVPAPAGSNGGATAPAAVSKPVPPKPPVKPKDEERRGFLMALVGSWFAFAWTTMAASLGLMTLGTLRFLFPNVLAEPPSKVKVGFPENFEEGKVAEKFKDQNIWVVRYEGKIYALSTTCTHLGCTPNWLENAAKFKCPCHGSGFYITGINFEGPAPRPLERWGVAIGDDGQIVVDKSKKFQQERGDWTNPESFITV